MWLQKETKMDEEFEKAVHRCNGVASVRKLCGKKPEFKRRWTESVEPVQFLIRNRFQRLKLKDEPVGAKDPVSELEIDILQRHLRKLYPGMNLEQLQKVQYRKSNKCQTYVSWKEKHCRETR